MKSYITNFIKILFVFCFIFFNTAGLAEACAPDIVGRVVTSTGAPVDGVWVKWTDYNNNTWHAKTDVNGNYHFPIWTYLQESERTTFRNNDIDTNLDRSNDSKQANIVTPDLYDQFECGSGETRVGHSFNAIKPVNMNGTFTSPNTGLNFNCGEGTYVLEDIVFTGTITTSTPTPTPVGLKTKTANFGIAPVSGISGYVYIDSDMDGSHDLGEEDVYRDSSGTEVTITGTSYKQTSTDPLGTFSFPGVPNGNYTVYLTLPPNYHSTSPTSVSVSLPPPAGNVSFGIVSSYTINGNVYNDINKNLRLDVGEPKITNAEIVSTGGFVLMYNGYYEVQDLTAGNYTLSYTTPLAKGYYYLHPKPASFPPTYQVTVGTGCSADFTTGGSCVNNSIVNLNFAVTDSMPWMQTYGMDSRFDNGYKNLLPAATACGGGSYASGTDSTFTSPGIIFTGDSSTGTDFGQGSASEVNWDWVVGGTSYPEVFKSSTPLKTSAQNLLTSAPKSGVYINDLSDFTHCQNPATTCDLEDLTSGFYHASGDIKIDKLANFNTGNYVIVADGNITFTNNATISVTSGSTLLFSSARDIIIDRSISSSTFECPVPAGQLQGIYSADHDIIIEGNEGDCKLESNADKMLNIDGILIVNAGKTGGKLDNNRDLCKNNRAFPSLTVKARPDFILNIPGFLTNQQTISHEESP